MPQIKYGDRPQISYVVLGATVEDYFDYLELHQGDTPEIYRDFQVYYSDKFIDILCLQKGCYSIPTLDIPSDEHPAIAKNFICQLLELAIAITPQLEVEGDRQIPQQRMR